MIDGQRFSIAVCGINSATDYSGGRYYAWMVAEALASRGHHVVVWTDNPPVFLDDFGLFPAHASIDLRCGRGMRRPPAGPFDLVVLVPHLARRHAFFPKTLLLARKHRSRLVLLSFETPNWYNLLSPAKRDAWLWDNWYRSSRDASLILSISAEGNRFATRFYTSCPTQTRFDYCYPSINSIVADSVVGVQREKRIILMTRFVWAEHKGGSSTPELICEAMRGYTLALIVGTGEVPPAQMDELRRRAAEHGVEIEVKYRLADRDKFREIKRASLMLFPSYFEGFGLPPVEAQYCNVPCIAFDLPVLREVSGDGLIYVEHGNWPQFRARIAEVLNSTNTYERLQDNIAEVACFENYVERIDRIVQRVMETDLPDESRAQRFVNTATLRAELCYSLLHNSLFGVARRLGRLALRLAVIVLQGVLPEETYQRFRAYIKGE